MKKLYVILWALLIILKIQAQAPNKMSYQAVVRDASNSLVSGKQVGVRISILQGSASGTEVYKETHLPTTNPNGLLSIEVGSGTALTGTFAAIDWSNGSYFIKSEIDPNGGSSFSITSTSQLLSVPYALSSNSASVAIRANVADSARVSSYAQKSKFSDSSKYSGHSIISDTAMNSKNTWSLVGNAGTDPATNFIGTTDDIDLVFKVNNQKAGFIETDDQNYNNTIKNGNTAYGYQSLFSNTSGYNNVASGSGALYSNTTGYRNVANGFGALYSNTTGYRNIANGSAALYYNTTGVSNVANGCGALFNNTTGNDNLANGDGALRSNTTGNYNLANGYQSLYSNTTGELNVAMGSEALKYSNSDWNTAVGSQSAKNVTTGQHNVGFGGQTLLNVVTGNNNIAIGTTCGPTGDFSNTISLGDNAFSNQSNKVRIGNTNITAIEGQVGFSTVSDGRFKTNVTEEVKGLDFIKLLRPVVYNFDTKKFADFLRPQKDIAAKNAEEKSGNQEYEKSTAIRHAGFIAQEVYEAAKKAGFDFNGVHKPENEQDNWSITYDKMVVPLVKAVQEQQVMIEKLLEKIDLLEKRINH